MRTDLQTIVTSSVGTWLRWRHWARAIASRRCGVTRPQFCAERVFLQPAVGQERVVERHYRVERPVTIQLSIRSLLRALWSNGSSYTSTQVMQAAGRPTPGERNAAYAQATPMQMAPGRAYLLSAQRVPPSSAANVTHLAQPVPRTIRHLEVVVRRATLVERMRESTSIVSTRVRGLAERVQLRVRRIEARSRPLDAPALVAVRRSQEATRESAQNVSTPFPPQQLAPSRTAAPTGRAPESLDIKHITTHVMREMDSKLRAWRERTGRA